ncbi:LOW QUALITY PROTEIN: hypothetical protein HID58_055737 [Brassica napus]|uniref:Uncharacterized protein n=1 Tax=Brassica napus TaxID=3708 RepID=A0ABQ8ALM8_BRANA|nr:LOW QUALITY PROTEIN: hypothetical protein HID58_055737 [Brassica napus]
MEGLTRPFMARVEIDPEAGMDRFWRRTRCLDNSFSLPPLGRATPSVFWMSLDDSSPLLESPLPWAWYMARNSGSKDYVFSGFFYSPLLQMSRGISTPSSRVSIFSGSFAGGGAAVFPALGQGSFRRTTPVEFDKYSKALYPLSYQELLFWLLQLLEFVKVVNPAGRSKTRNQQEPTIVEVGFEAETRNQQELAGTRSDPCSALRNDRRKDTYR